MTILLYDLASYNNVKRLYKFPVGAQDLHDKIFRRPPSTFTILLLFSFFPSPHHPAENIYTMTLYIRF